jgi:hypothetical protein
MSYSNFTVGVSYDHVVHEPIKTCVEATFHVESQMASCDMQEHLLVIINNPHMVASLPSFLRNYDQHLPNCTIHPIFKVNNRPTGNVRVAHAEVNMTLYLPGSYYSGDLTSAITEWIHQSFKANINDITVKCLCFE